MAIQFGFLAPAPQRGLWYTKFSRHCRLGFAFLYLRYGFHLLSVRQLLQTAFVLSVLLNSHHFVFHGEIWEHQKVNSEGLMAVQD